MKIENVEVDRAEIIKCLDIAYHELRYLYGKQQVFASEVIRGAMHVDLRKEYYRHPEFRKRLNSVLIYAIRHGKSVIAYAEGRKKQHRMPRVESRKVDDVDLELLVGLSNVAILSPEKMLE